MIKKSKKDLYFSIMAEEAAGPKLVGVAYAAARLWPADTIAALKQRLPLTPQDSLTYIELLSLAAGIKEESERRAAGMPTANAPTLADMPYRFARDELVALQQAALPILQQQRSASMAIVIAEAHLALGALNDAERVFKMLRNENVLELATTTSFDKEFHATLPSVAAAGFADFPAVETIMSGAPSDQPIFVAADHVYFQKYGPTLLNSVHENRAGVSVALHIMDVEDAQKEALRAVLAPYASILHSVTTEWTGLRDEAARARGYYHAVRYIRFYEFLARHRTPTWLLDIDMVVRREAAKAFTILNGCDAALQLLAGRREARNQIMASSVGIAPTPGGLDYLGRAAAYIATFARAKKFPWGIDQVALYACLKRTPTLKIAAVTQDIVGGEDSLFVATKSGA